MLTSTRQLTAVDGQRQKSERIEVLHWDGRLDNRDDLLLRLRDALAGDNSNAAIARATYERWDVDGLVNLIARISWGVGAWLRNVQTGYLRSYILFLALAAVGIWIVFRSFQAN